MTRNKKNLDISNLIDLYVLSLIQRYSLYLQEELGKHTGLIDTFEEETVLTGPLLGLTLSFKTDKLTYITTCFSTQIYRTESTAGSDQREPPRLALEVGGLYRQPCLA